MAEQLLEIKDLHAGVEDKEILKGLSVFCSACRASDAVDMKLNVFHTHFIEEIMPYRDNVAVGEHIRRSEDLQSNLMELTQPSGLRLLIAEARYYVIVLRRLYVRKNLMFNKRPHYRLCPFRLQRYAPPGVILKCVHLFLYDIGSVTYTAQEQLSVLEHRGPYLSEPIISAHLSEALLDVLPLVYLVRQNIFSTFWCVSQHYYPPK